MTTEKLFASRVPEPDESLTGFVLRLVEANRLERLRWLLDAVSDRCDQHLTGIGTLVTSPSALAALEALAELPGGLLQRQALRPYQSATRRPHGTTTERTLLRHGEHFLDECLWEMPNDQVCPLCLRHGAYLRKAWQFSHAPVCIEHRCELVPDCPSCGKRLRLDRASVVHCGACGCDLRNADTRQVSDDCLPAARAVQMWRITSLGEPGFDGPVDPEGLVLLLCLLVPVQDGDPRDLAMDGRLDRLPTPRRVAALERLGATWDGRRFRGSAIREAFVRRWYYFMSLQRPGLYLSRWLRASEALETGFEITSLLPHSHGLAPSPRAVEVFGRRPPRFLTPTDVARFLQVPQPVVERLSARLGILTRPPRGEGYDADELLEAQRFLSELYSAEEFDLAVGFKGAAVTLADLNLVEPFGTGYGRTLGYMPESLASLLDRVAERLRPDLRQASDLRLADAVGDSTAAAEFGRLIANLVSGALQATGWAAPYRLVDLLIPSREAITAIPDATAEV